MNRCEIKGITMITRQRVVMQTYVFGRLDHLVSQPFTQLI